MSSLVAQSVKNLPAVQETRVRSLCLEDPRRRKWQPTPIFLPGESHGWRSLVGYSPLRCKESDTTEWLHFHFHREHCVWFKFLWIKNQRKYVSVYIQIHTCMCIYTWYIYMYVVYTYTHMRKHTYKSFFKTNNLKKSINRGRYMEEPGSLQSMGSLRVGHDWCNLACTPLLLMTAYSTTQIIY